MFIYANVIFFNIRKDTIVEKNFIGSMHLKSLGGRFHDHCIDSFVPHLPKSLLQGVGFRCGIARLFMDSHIIDSRCTD